MKAAGVREVKDHLSAYLRRVQRGEVIRITDRGRVVAELRPPRESDEDAPSYERMVAEGKVTPPSRPWNTALVTTPRSRKALPAGFANALIDAEREERA